MQVFRLSRTHGPARHATPRLATARVRERQTRAPLLGPGAIHPDKRLFFYGVQRRAREKTVPGHCGPGGQSSATRSHRQSRWKVLEWNA